jgi:ferredoxin-NADP reductase/Na+-translocating ferredoxin:NAD+ oxidoreductase RnfD subunit
MLAIISRPYQSLQNFVDSIGMYRLVLGSLFVLAACSVLAGFIGLVAFGGLVQIFTLALALLVALLLNWLIALITKIPANHESAAITALILFFLAAPESNIFENWPLVLAVTIAILSKFLLVYKKQHFLNPAALGAAALSTTGVHTFSWWVANPVLFVPLLIVGILVVMKVRKWVPVLTFVAVSLVIYVAEALSYGDVFVKTLSTFFLSWPTLFLAFYMITEPFTMPSMKRPQVLYGGLVGFLSNSSIFNSVLSISPELALVIANVAMLPWRVRQKLFLVFESKRIIAKDTYEFVFHKPAGFSFKAGQYLEWMLEHDDVDSRGTRRYFTIASSPTEKKLRLAFKVVQEGSSYKCELMKLDVGEKIIASQLAGDFILPNVEGAKLGFIAGGIGVTPFRSHIQYMVDTGKVHDTKLLYCCNEMSELAYGEEFGVATAKMPLEVIPIIAKEVVAAPAETGYVTADILKRRVPDYKERTWYISGPPPMVSAYTKLLKGMGISRKQIKRDFFPGVM